MDKATFLGILQIIVEGFEDPAFRKQFAAAKASGDVPQMMALPMAIQERAFAAHQLDAETATAKFKEAGRSFGLDDDVAPWLARMKAALG